VGRNSSVNSGRAEGDATQVGRGAERTSWQYLKAGLLDEMQIHLIPILLGGGVRLFEDLDPEGIELRRTSSIETPGATHLRLEVVK
jgi:dihydrofolate reductase